MIIYNYKKEFLGIDEKDLQTLGLKNLEDLQEKVSDFADLFVKTPGCVHNFKHVHWIDFVLCAEPNTESKVIIHLNDRNYSAILQITISYLVDNPSSKAYMVHLKHLHDLTSQESENITDNIVEVPIVTQKIDDMPLDLDIDFTDDLDLDTLPEKEVFDNGYIYDPKVASEGLNLPLDLIEEFIQDFIQQARDFKENLYSSLHDGDLENLKELTHKLKGVAANLHIEDALTTLIEIKASSDLTVIENNLDIFYKIIAKLAGEKINKKLTPLTIYDKKKVANEIGLDLESFEELFKEYVIEIEILIQKIEDAIESEDFDTRKSVTLQLKKISINMKITSFTHELQKLIDSSDKQELQDTLATIKASIATL